MSSILDLEIFVRVADAGSISAAARALELTPAAASIALKRLETRLGIRLFARSTRSIRLTEEGRRYLESVRLALAALAEGERRPERRVATGRAVGLRAQRVVAMARRFQA